MAKRAKVDRAPAKDRPASRHNAHQRPSGRYSPRGEQGEQQAGGKLSRGVAAESTHSVGNYTNPARDKFYMDGRFGGLFGECLTTRESVVEVLREARVRLNQSRWTGLAYALDADGKPTQLPEYGCRPVAFSILASVDQCSDWEGLSRLAAVGVLRAVAGMPIPHWERHPFREKRDALELIDRAIRLLGGTPPSRGGWVVRTSYPGGKHEAEA